MASSSTFPIEELPVELLLLIARRLPDLASLHALASVVPTVFRLLERYGGELLLALTADPAVTVPQVRDAIHVVALVRAAALPAGTLYGFVRGFLQPTMAAAEPPPRRPPGGAPVAPALPYGVLVAAQRVRAWSRACLACHLARLRDAQPRLRRPADADFGFTRNYNPGYRPADAVFCYAPGYIPGHPLAPDWRRRCEGVPYATPVQGPASWVEEQIVARAFWRLQLFLDLRSAAREGRLAAWPDGDVRRLSDVKLEELFVPASPLEAQHQELLTVAEFLQDTVGHVPGPSLPAIADPMPQEISEAVPEASDPYDPRTLVSPYWYLPRGLQVRPAIDLTFASVLQSKQSPARGVSPRLFRRLGLAIWERSRLASLGLSEAHAPVIGGGGRHGFARPCSDFWFQWRSLLRPDEIALEEDRLARQAEEEKRLGGLRPAWWGETGAWD